MDDDRKKNSIGLLAGSNGLAIIGVLLFYPYLGIWTLALGLGVAFLMAVLVYWYLQSQLADRNKDYAERFAVHREAFDLLDQYLKLEQASDDREFFKELLDHTLGVTASEFGFIGVVLKDEYGKPFLRTRWITDIAWNEASRQAYSAQGMEFTNLDSLFGYTLRTGEHLITNEPDQHSEAGGFPPGHPLVKSYMGVPLKNGGELVGMIGLGNRPGGFELEDLRRWQVFFDVCAEIIRHNQLQTDVNDAHERYRQLFDDAPLMYILTEPGQDAEGNICPLIADCNTTFSNRLGYSKDEIIGRPVLDFYDEASGRMLTGGGYTEALAGGVFEEPRVLVNRAGEHIQTVMRALPIQGERGVPVGTRAMFLDVSDLYSAQERNRSLELGLRRFLSGASTLIVEFAEDLSTLSMSAGMQRLLRFGNTIESPHDFLSRIIEDEAREKLSLELTRLFQGDTHQSNDFSMEITVRTNYGDEISLLVSLDILVGEAGESSVWLAAQDISESRMRAQLEAESRRAESLDKLTGNIAHEFNNLFTVISRNIPVINSMNSDAEERGSALEDIDSAISEAFDLTQTLLAYSGQQVLRPSTVMLESVLAAMLQKIRAQIGPQPAITLINDAPGQYCRIDQARLEELVWNIVENAVEASPFTSSVEIHIRKVETTMLDVSSYRELIPGSYLLICVRDEGHGMSESLLQRVQEPFFSTRRKRGLGLSNVRGILKQSGGALTIVSKEGLGTNVCIWLPDDKLKASYSLSDLTKRLSSFSGRACLLSEDEVTFRQISSTLSYSSIQLRLLSEIAPLQEVAAFDLVLIDMRCNLEIIDQMCSSLDPDIKIILVEHALGQSIDSLPGSSLAGTFTIPFPLTSVSVVDTIEKALLK